MLFVLDKFLFAYIKLFTSFHTRLCHFFGLYTFTVRPSCSRRVAQQQRALVLNELVFNQTLSVFPCLCHGDQEQTSCGGRRQQRCDSVACTACAKVLSQSDVMQFDCTYSCRFALHCASAGFTPEAQSKITASCRCHPFDLVSDGF